LTEPQSGERIHAHLDAISEAMAPWIGGRYLNLADRVSDTADSFEAETYQRLREAKSRYDDVNLFRSNHAISPAATHRHEDER
jgi:hypothetical protein